MPRLARQYLGTSFFHVMVQGIKKEYIFNNNKLIEKYIEIMNKYIKEYDVEIIAYCIMSNHAHFLIYTEKIEEMSNLMHKVNSTYASFYNKFNGDRAGHVLRNRFKSQPIKNKRYLNNCIKYLHQNPVKANIVEKSDKYKYSSYNEYKNHKKKFQHQEIYKIIKEEDYENIIENKNTLNIFIDIEKNQKDIIENAIKEFTEERQIDLKEIFINRNDLKELIKYMKTNKNIKYREIMQELEITQGTMKRLTKTK